MKKDVKKFKLNVIVSYAKTVNVNNYRNPILTILKNFAWLYKLDYSIDVKSEVFENIEASHYQNPDLIYFRSTDQTQIDLKKFQKIISDVFVYNPFFEGVEVLYQLQKALKEYPFPKDFYRPLNYPYIEMYKGSQSEIIILDDDWQKLFPDLHID